MAALLRVDNFFLFSRRVLALKGADEPPLREAAATLAARLRAGAENPSNPVSFLRLLADVDAANGSKQTHSRRQFRDFKDN